VPHRQIEDPGTLRRLIDAVLMLEADVELPVLLRHFVEEACSLVGARYGALGVLNASRTGLEEFITVGLSEAEERSIGARPSGRGLLGLLISEPETLRLRDLSEHPRRWGFPEHHPPMKTFLGVPLRVRDEVYGNLYLTDKVRSEEFTAEDAAAAEALALAAGIAIENARFHDQIRELDVLDDRERIGRDLHDRVIQRLYAVGMALQGALRPPELPLVVDRMNKAIDELDDTISEIRGAIFELGDQHRSAGVRQRLLSLTRELEPALGMRPRVSFRGPIDNGIPDAVADHLLAVAREALTNAGKHARASEIVVKLMVAESITLTVTDDGVGPGAGVRSGGRGLGNLQRRAVMLGGSFELESIDGGGTLVRWAVPR
jgi:signal transduction histidine kinase